MGWGKLTAWNRLSEPTSGGGTAPPDSNTQRYFAKRESVSGLNVTLGANERFEVAFMLFHTDNFQEILKGADTAVKLNNGYYSSAAITVATAGNSTKYLNTAASYSHGCFNTLAIQMNANGNGYELFMNGESLGSESLGSASFNISNIGDGLRYIRRLSHFNSTGTEVLRYDFTESSGVTVSPAIGTGDLTFSTEPKRFYFINTNDVWTSLPLTFPDPVKISIPEDAPIYRATPVVKPAGIIFIHDAGQSLAMNFMDGVANEPRNTATIENGYVVAGGGLAKFPCRRDIFSRGRISIETANEFSSQAFIYANTGVANTAIANLNKGNESYDKIYGESRQLDSNITAIAPDTNLTGFVTCFTHGEADASDESGAVTPVATYESLFKGYKSDAKADVIRATGNANIDYKFVYTQLGRPGQSQDLMNWFYDHAVSTTDTDYVYAGPRWWLNAYYFDQLKTIGGNPAPDPVHLSPYGFALLEEMHGQAIADPDWQPLLHTSCTSDITNNSQIVQIQFAVQTLPLRKFIDVPDDTLGVAYVNASGVKSEVDLVTINGSMLTIDIGKPVEAGSKLRFGAGARSSDQPKVNLMDSTAYIGPDTGYEHNQMMSVADIDISPVPAESTDPTPNAGSDQQNIISGGTLTLNGSNTLDPSNVIVNIQWNQTAGTNAIINDPGELISSVTLPTVTANETMTFELTITDSSGNTYTDSVSFSVLAIAASSLRIDSYTIKFKDNKQKVIKGFDNEVFIDFTFANDFTLSEFTVIEVKIGDETYSTIDDPTQVYILENRLVLNIGENTTLEVNKYKPLIIGKNAYYNSGHVFTSPVNPVLSGDLDVIELS